MRIIKMTIAFLLIVLSGNEKMIAQARSFTNPLLPAGADPWCIYKSGFYYYTNTTGKNISVWKTKNIADLKSAPVEVIFTPPPGKPYSQDLWAPEIHFILGKWYVYFAADSGGNINHRLWVLENSAPDPLQGEWNLKGQLTTPDNKWSIDGSLFEHNNQLYLIWSGWEGNANGQQNIYIAKMKNPWTVAGERVKLSSPELNWETVGDLHNANDVGHVNVNEGPEVLRHGNKLFLIYSASGCWTDNYSLGMLTASADSDPMNPSSWTKSPQPVFKQNPANGVYAPGHHGRNHFIGKKTVHRILACR